MAKTRIILPDDDSSSALLRDFLGGDADAIAAVMSRYYETMANMAAHMIRAYRVDPSILDRDDAVSITLFRLWRAIQNNRGFVLETTGDFWRIFRLAIERNVLHARARGARLKRGGRTGRTAFGSLSANEATGAGQSSAPKSYRRRISNPENLPSGMLPPDVCSIADDEAARLLSLLDDPVLKAVVIWRSENYTTAEIAHRLGITTRSVRRKLALIRATWALERGDGRAPSRRLHDASS